MPVETLRCRAILFDFDGVLVDSAAHIERHWQRWAADHDVDFAAIMQVAHGRRMLETLQIVAPHLDAEAEARRYSAIQAADAGDVVTMDGAAALLNSLPPGTWAIVTSGFGIVVPVMLRNGGLPAPEVLVTADDVVHGKPSPEPYLLAAARLSRTPAECVVVEDSPAGLAAAAAAGMRSVAVASTHAAAELHAGTLLAPRLADIRVTPDADGTLVIEIARGG